MINMTSDFIPGKYNIKFKRNSKPISNEDYNRLVEEYDLHLFDEPKSFVYVCPWYSYFEIEGEYVILTGYNANNPNFGTCICKYPINIANKLFNNYIDISAEDHDDDILDFLRNELKWIVEKA